MIRGLIFDLNGTVIDIRTDEWDSHTYRVTANFLDYYGIRVLPERLKKMYFELNRRQRKNSPEKFPEIDVPGIFRTIIADLTGDGDFPEHLPETAAIVFRAASRYKLQAYPDAGRILNSLKDQYLLAALSDGQSAWALPELRAAGLEKFFSPILISGNAGFRKPDPRLFESVLDQLNLRPEEAVFVGNDMYRDIYGANKAGMRTVLFRSGQGDQNDHGAEPDYIIYHFRELPDAISFLNGPDISPET